jgi:two-component system, cell cycle response regulator
MRCGRPSFLRLVELLFLAGIAFHALHAGLDLGGARLDTFADTWLYSGLLVAGALACLARALTRRKERAAWLVFGLALSAWALGDLYDSLVLAGQASPPYPSVADFLWLAFYPAVYAGVVLLLEARVENLSASIRLDGAIAGAAVTGLGAALLFPRYADDSGSTAAVATNLAYPLGDLLLVAAVVGAFTLAGGQSGWVFALLTAGLLTTAVADFAYLEGVAQGTWVDGTLWDTLWPVGMYLVARAAWTRSGRASRIDLGGRSLIIVPAVSGLIGIGLLVWDHFHRLHPVAVGAAAVALGAVLVRLALTFRENARILDKVQEQSLTDTLTGLGNRRRLLRDVERRLTAREPGLLVILDLDGFKAYNDTYGHPAGDSLLRRLGERLVQAARPFGQAYRLGGDEFCALLDVRPASMETALDAVATALTDEGENFAVSASFGAVVLCEEVETTTDALKLADQRLYAQKRDRRSADGRQPHDVLLRVLFEREPQLHGHMHEVSELSRSVGERLGLGRAAVDQVAHAAELHDIGKLAIPDTILHKPGPLSADELAYVRKHTLVGARILGAAPALREVAALVRASHERWDGTGYPDGLAGEEIPLGARIVAVCDAFDAMISPRPYRPARTHEAAIAELARCSGSQFDPAVVAAFCAAWSERRAGDSVAAG